MPAPKLQQVTLVVGSSEASAAFYRELGLPVPEDAGGVHVEMSPTDPARRTRPPEPSPDP